MQNPLEPHQTAKLETTTSSVSHETQENEIIPRPKPTTVTEATTTESGTTVGETTSADTTIPSTTTTTTTEAISGQKHVEPCNQTICVEQICKVNGSISRPSFYARCPSQPENDEDLTNYCMCAAAYHAAPGLTSDGEPGQSYVLISPDINCIIPETDEDKRLCEQEKCQGASKKANRQAHICEADGKYYCACFN